MILTDKEMKIFSMYVKNDLFFFKDGAYGRTWDCRDQEMNNCEECHFSNRNGNTADRCPVVDDAELEKQIKNAYPQEFE